ncbi:MAG: 2'-5' RNA ligase [Crenarchaeota archaeon]|nr:MAG: 2'-5' RNA ligase [Thermoproteota archaeon]
MNYVKYPRTKHLPFSQTVTTDDKMLDSTEHFVGKHVVVSEKLDGENTTLYCDYIHARSIDSKHHNSRNWVKNLHGEIGVDIPFGYRVCGENLYAKHSIFYDSLPSYFLMFSIWHENTCLSWDETEDWADLLGIKTVPILYEGLWDETEILKCWKGKSFYGLEQEGYVVRLADRFSLDEFDKSVAKFVRENHVQTDSHWAHSEIIPNKLCSLHSASSVVK